ncbi:MAG: nitrate reductase [Gammaproteobacteria bacterium]|jgi:nitrate reductase gamma subunit|nr:nitrate reductase [Gammaproteobacteria bacterium]MDH3804275.1 nitrate reductase [Gammaproteobacteria bacterium]
MTLLDFASGPGMQWALWIFVFGVLWRLVGALFLLSRKDLTKPRQYNSVAAGLGAIISRSAPAHAFEKRILFQHVTGYVWHFALFISVLFFAPHILFFESVLGFGWPHLPNTIILITAIIATAVLITLLIRRATHPVQRFISNADDYISIFVVLIPLITGILAFAHVGGRYETLLAIHLLSVEVMLIWFPFGKLMHAIMTMPARYQAGTAFGRRGVKA